MKQIIKYVISWQIFVIVVTLLSGQFLNLNEKYLGAKSEIYSQNPLLYSRANFDGIHYTEIAKRGYVFPQQAFFPLYPNLIRSIDGLTHNSALSGTIISLFCFVLALVVLERLIKLDYSESVAKWTILALLFFPTSFYFGFVYTESLFFLLVVMTFYLARKQSWLLAGIFGALACYTRFVGIFLFPALLIEWWRNRKLINLAYISIIPLGLLAYMRYLSDTTGNPLMFYHAQSFFNQGRSNDKIILLYQVFWRYVKMLSTVSWLNPLYPTIILEFITGITFFLSSIFSLFKQRPSYAFFAISAYLVPTLTGSLTSVPRYVLVCFPAFILFGQYLDKSKYRYMWLTVLALASTIYISLFVRGYWIG